MLADGVLHTRRQEDDRHFDAEASGVILLKFSRYLHCSASGRCVFATDGASRCDFVLVRFCYHRTYVFI